MKKADIINCAKYRTERGRDTYLYGEADNCPRERRLGLNLLAAGLISQNPPRAVDRKRIYGKEQIEE